ncbi:MAG: HK97 gp10 family phage protein [Bacteroidales bacterium]|nr:HK97 gp10 family phage protein [Bacteroidales bacterium]
MNIRIEGINELVNKLNKLVDGADSGLQKGLLEGGELVRSDAVMNVPVDSGELRESIVVELLDKTAVAITATAEHGIYVEFGTGSKGDSSVSHTTKKGWVYFNENTNSFVYTTGQAPQPFLVPALFNQKDAVIQAIKNGILGAI